MKLYNTMTRTIEELSPLEDGVVKMYNCGLTVYSQPHIGNWLGYIYWDVLVRTLEAEGYRVDRTQNITDVGHLTSDDDNGEDKMEKGAAPKASPPGTLPKNTSTSPTMRAMTFWDYYHRPTSCAPLT